MKNIANLIKPSSIALCCVLLLAVFATGTWAADAEKPAATLFKNVKVFNGTDDKLIDAGEGLEGPAGCLPRTGDSDAGAAVAGRRIRRLSSSAGSRC